MGYCPESSSTYVTATGGRRDKSTPFKETNLQHLVTHPNFFMVVGVTLGKLIDFDPKLLDFPFDLPHTNTSQAHHLTSKARRQNVAVAHISDHLTDLLLLYGHLCRCHAVRFGQHRNYIDFSMQGLHTLHVQRSEAAHMQTCVNIHLQTDMDQRGSGLSVPVAEWGDEVQAAVDSVVFDVPPVQAALVSKILLKLQVDVVLYVLPADGQT